MDKKIFIQFIKYNCCRKKKKINQNKGANKTHKQ